jgi:hypothetical protein
MFDAVLAEYAFARLFGDQPGGERRDLYDATLFRSGDPKALGRLIQLTSRWLLERLDAIPFAPEESLRAGAKVRLDVAVERLERHGEEMRRSMPESREDIRWSVIADLLDCVTALLDHLEGKGAGEAKE